MGNKLGKPISQRLLRVGVMNKQSIGMNFVSNDAKEPNLVADFLNKMQSVCKLPISIKTRIIFTIFCILYSYKIKTVGIRWAN